MRNRKYSDIINCFTNNFFIKLSVRSIIATKTVNQDAIGSGLNHALQEWGLESAGLAALG